MFLYNTKKTSGFTLVELLIVIALIAVLSVAVLATINPIEQTNKARDAQFKNDAAEIMNAYERYYASQNMYPWNAAVGASVPAGTNDIAFISRDARFGVLDVTGALPASGELIATSELKSAFGGKAPFKPTVDNTSEDAMYIWHSNDSNYVCFCPKANANRTGAIKNNLKCVRNLSTVGAAYTPAGALEDAGDAATCTVPTATDAKATGFCTSTNTYANLLCVPEGNID